MKFESSLEKLEKILSSLEDGQASIEDSLRLFEQGVQITKECFDYLDTYQGKLTVLRQQLDDISPKKGK